MRYPVHHTLIFLLLLCLGLQACRPLSNTIEPPPTANTPEIEIILPEPEETVALLPENTPVSETNLDPSAQALPLPNSRYVLTATLDYWNHHLKVDQRIDYVNHTETDLSDLVLMVEPLYFPGTFHLKSLRWEGGLEIKASQTLTATIRIPLEQLLPAGQTISLVLAYEMDLPSPQPNSQIRPIPFGYTDRQTNLVDWYPFIPAYHKQQGWLAHKASFYGEHLVYEAVDFDLRLRLEDTSRLPLIVAASAPVDLNGDWRYYRLNNARNFVFSVSHQYQVITQTVGGISVVGYAFPFHASAGKVALQTTAESLALYSRLYHPYPHQSLSVVEADFLDGMEYDGLYFLSNGFYNLYREGEVGSYLTAIAAHETAHEWWYALVGNDQALEPWLDEALCTYNEHIFFERLYPQALDWWWNYRVNYYQPQGWVDTTIYNPEGKSAAYRSYRDAVYLNGAIFLDDLRKKIGDEAFFAFMKAYASRKAYQIADTQDFFSILNEYVSDDLTPLLEKYFHNSVK